MSAPFTVTWQKTDALYERQLRSVREVEQLLQSVRAPASAYDAAGRLIGEAHDRSSNHLPHRQQWRWWLRRV